MKNIYFIALLIVSSCSYPVIDSDILVYENSFEWRFEFPEVLGVNGEYIGFDTVIGNPPYVNFRDIKDKTEKAYLNNKYSIAEYQSDLFIDSYLLSVDTPQMGGAIMLLRSKSRCK